MASAKVAAEIAELEERLPKVIDLGLSAAAIRQLHPLFLELRQDHGLHLASVVRRGVLDVLGLLRRSKPPLGRGTAQTVESLRVGERKHALLDLVSVSALVELELPHLAVSLIAKAGRLLSPLAFSVVLVILLQTDADLVDILEILRAVEGLPIRVQLA